MENTLDISDCLRNEVKQSHAPVTGYYIACAIVTERGVYFDHNYEYEDSLVFEHAEQRALARAIEEEGSPQIKKVLMYGEGKVKKFKHYIPCCVCGDRMKPYTSPKTSVDLLPLKNTDPEYSLNFDEMLQSYSPKEYSKIDISSELKEKTILNEKDQKFISNLVILGDENAAKFFLTGSASGRGGFSNLLLTKLKTTYGDMDLFCVLNNSDSLDGLIESIENLIKFHYGPLNKVVRNLPKYQNRDGVVLSKIYYHTDSNPEPFIDLTFSLKLAGSFIRAEYFDRNWFHELS